MKAVIVIPAFNESEVIHKVLKSLPKRLKGISDIDIVVVNDGSTDETLKEIIAANANFVNHLINRGVGAATKTGIHWASDKNADIVVTFDADGQHHPGDIEKIIKPILAKKADVVIGSRFKRQQRVPLDRLFLNWFANIATLFLFGIYSTDSQSGLRAFSKKALKLVDFKAERMEFSSEVLLEAKRHNLKIAEVPIHAIYTDYSREKGQKNLNAIPIFAKFLVRLLR